jgi:hypothetical protein
MCAIMPEATRFLDNYTWKYIVLHNFLTKSLRNLGSKVELMKILL